MIESPLVWPILFYLGPIPITEPVATTWGVMLVLTLGAKFVARFTHDLTSSICVTLEFFVEGMQKQIQEAMNVADGRPYLALIGTIFIYLLAANLSGLLPGIESPTGNIETAGALALIVFFAVHYYGVKSLGLRGYLSRFVRPVWIMLPLNLISEVTRTLSLGVRLFGNVMSGAFIVAITISLAGLFVPVPLMALEMITSIIQAYIFTVLATVYIGGGISSQN